MGKRRSSRYHEDSAEDWEGSDLESRGPRRRDKPSKWRQYWQQVAMSALFLFLFWRAYIANPNATCPRCEDCSLALREHLQQSGGSVASTGDTVEVPSELGQAKASSEEGSTSSTDESSDETIHSAPLSQATADTPAVPEPVAEQASVGTSNEQQISSFPETGASSTAATFDAAQSNFKVDLGVLTFYGQDGGGHNQPDKIVFETFFKDPPVVNGIFVEIGAQDGLSRTNTLFFEETLNWNGILVEAATPNFEKLKEAQSKRRKNSQIVHAAACPKEGTVRFIGDGGTAGRVERLAPAFVEKWSRYWKTPWNEEYEVPCEPTSAILSRAGFHQVDFMSIDVEGSELDFLETIDFDIVMIRVLVFEGGMDAIRDAVARDLLKNKGFCHAFDVSTNQYWVKDPVLARRVCNNL
mmetsp:Transcript_6267/g.18909  ORF Transcript_6267/g.18909 Transcript_6267/m.18909 type:complete len:411 (+) Transcript_6267:106-1338(+)